MSGSPIPSFEVVPRGSPEKSNKFSIHSGVEISNNGFEIVRKSSAKKIIYLVKNPEKLSAGMGSERTRELNRLSLAVAGARMVEVFFTSTPSSPTESTSTL